MFVLRNAGQKVKRMCFRTLLVWLLLVVLAIHSGNSAYTFFRQLVQYKGNNVIPFVAAFNSVLCVKSLMSLQ